ncbi:MAG TPA: AEC family transporter [Acetobacteraceae bacterium]|nr:AEC family transporter [Acetobacteraceae bacterium]
MTTILGVVAPVFAIIALGWIAASRRFVDEAGFRGLNAFTFNLAAPALLFAGGTSPHEGGGMAAFVFFLGSVAIFGAGVLVARAVLRQDLGAAALFALNAAFGNTVMMGIPLIVAAYGQPGLVILIAILALHSMVLLGLATVVAEIGLNAAASWRRVLRATSLGVARNPVVVTVFVAFLWHRLGLPVPGPVRRTLELLGAAAPPTALFCLGGSLAGFSLAHAWREVAWLSVLKLLAMPLLVWGLCLAFGLGPLDTAVAVTTAALPTGANAFLLARRYAIGAEASGATVLVSTLISVVTLAAVLALFQD